MIAHSNGQQVRSFVDRDLRSFAIKDSIVDEIGDAALEQLRDARSAPGHEAGDGDGPPHRFVVGLKVFEQVP